MTAVVCAQEENDDQIRVWIDAYPFKEGETELLQDYIKVARIFDDLRRRLSALLKEA